MTFSDERVRAAVEQRFVPLSLDLFRDPREWLRPLGVIWTPTVLFLDRRGAVRYQSPDFLPPELFLDLLDLGEGHVALHWARFTDALRLFGHVAMRDPVSPWAPEAHYWWGVAVYLVTRSRTELDRVWARLRERFPGSIWAARAVSD
ncbi:hypothetical protein OO015_04720 [Thermomicrobium sp. 4228-Ro]|uniref:hypothetical protein n=1 Tax=Thermomicrobium sp. 4228-Ro TaxID=2993937 RepID=UPI002249857D|nr:hypothetical protein [Thermomicrobium sp. 4228-Ro]MCX2726798.1 hypothetical protein [Thermomicrobium sp. 4228-Ro]